ncbi:MAG: hypothetical protein SOV59_11025 [Fusobacterium mortiferum]|nr:hypothetical protein [Fusobacterium mortiferum]
MYEKLIYLFLKLRLILFANFRLKKYKIGRNSFFLGEKKEKYNTILIYLNNRYLAHMGDQIFFEPLMQILKEKEIDFEICITEPLKDYFKSLNYRVIQKPNWNNYDLIISRSDFYYELRNKKNIFLIKTLNLEERICKTVCKEVINFLKLDIKNIDKSISKIKIANIIKNKYIIDIINDKDNEYIVFSNYIDSGSMFSNKKNFERLEEFCKKYKKNKKVKVLHIGTKKDKINDSKIYEYVDIDLRGKTTITELMWLISNNNIKTYIGMDNFVMHIFYIYFKGVNVCIRSKGSKARKEQILNYINPPFEMKKMDINYI